MPSYRWQPQHAARLDDERATAGAQLEGLHRDFEALVAASAGSNADDEHDPEGATIAYERSQLVAVIRQVEGHLADIVQAKSRLAEGRYGVCTVCGRAIPEARLQARPVACTCVACA